MMRAIRSWWLHAVFLLSGVAGLGYQIVWTRMFAVGLGHEVPGMLAVVAAFFGGLALGSFGLDRIVSRSRLPGRWYAGLEVLIGGWGLATIWLIPWANDLAARLMGQSPGPAHHWSVAFLVPALVLLPATTAMGATLPAMDRLVCRLRARGREVGGLYAANTAGALVGTLASAFLLIAALGTAGTVIVLATLNLISAIAVASVPARMERALEDVVDPVPGAPGWPRLAVMLAGTGLLGIGYEMLAVRVMAQVLQNTVYSFASGLSVYLLGTAIGAAAYQAWLRRLPFDRAGPWLVALVSASCALGALVLGEAREIYTSTLAVLGRGFAQGVAAELLLAAAVFGPPTVLMGALFSLLAQSARSGRAGVGTALGLNTVGGMLAPAVFGVLLLPWIGAKWSLVVVAAGYLPLMPLRRAKDALPIVIAAAAIGAAVPADLALVRAPEGGRVVEHREGVLGVVAVVSGPPERPGRDEELYLKVNDKFTMGGTRAGFAERRQGHIPLLLHPDPRRALFLGVGTGTTAAAAASHPGVRADAVELVPEIVELLPRFGAVNEGIGSEAITIYAADARRFVRVASGEPEGGYDVIVADLFHPARDGAGSLYTVEHFRAIRDRLAPGGLFCQWLPLYQLDSDMVAVIARTFLDVFPDCDAYLCDFSVGTPMLGLVGYTERPAHGAGWFDERVTDPALRSELVVRALRDDLTLFGPYLGGPASVARIAGEGPLNTDRLPIVTFRAPRFTYGAASAPRRVLAGVLGAVRPDANAGFGADGSGESAVFTDRLGRYWRARDMYLRGMMLLAEGDQAGAVEMLLRSAETSVDFVLAPKFLVQQAARMAMQDPASATALVDRVLEVRPENIDARRLKAQLRRR